MNLTAFSSSLNPTRSIHIGIGEWAISADESTTIKTFALGSCVSVAVYDPFIKTGGLTHFALPDSSLNAQKASELKGYFVNTGLPLFLEELKKSGVNLLRASLELYGGANILATGITFDIGKRNILMVKKILWQLGHAIHREESGGNVSRTVYLDIGNGKVAINANQSKKLQSDIKEAP